jgi:hypothetical protein
VLATLLAVCTQLPASATAFGYSIRLPIPAGLGKTTDATASAVSCTSKGSCVAVGDYVVGPHGGTSQGPIIFTERSGRWTSGPRLALPNNATDRFSSLSAVSCPSVGTCVATGDYLVGQVYKPLVVTETSGKWGREIEAPLPSNSSHAKNSLAALFSVSCSVAGSCVAVGQYNTGSTVQGFIDTQSSGGWTSMQAPMPIGTASSSLHSVSCAPGGGSCEAVGWYVGPKLARPVALEEIGGIWYRGAGIATPSNAAPVSPDNLDYPSLSAISCPASRSCNAGGQYWTKQGNAEPFFASDSAGVWGAAHEANLPSAALTKYQAASIQAIDCTSTARCAAAGSYEAAFGREEASAVAVTFTRAGTTWARGIDVSVPPTTSAVGVPESHGTSVSCPSVWTCIVVSSYSDGRSPYSIGSFASAPAALPSAPRIDKVTPTTMGFDLSIEPPASNGGMRVTTYQYSTDGGSTWKNRTSGTNSTKIVLTNLKTHHTYRLAIRAVTGAGTGPGSNDVMATTS